MFCSFLFFVSSFVPKGFSSSKSCTRILFRKIRTLPDFCCYLIIVVVLFRQNYYPQIVDWFPTSRECVCMEFVCWLVVGGYRFVFSWQDFKSAFLWPVQLREFAVFFYEVFHLFAYTIFLTLHLWFVVFYCIYLKNFCWFINTSWRDGGIYSFNW